MRDIVIRKWLICALFLTGCATHITTQQGVLQNMRVSEDPYTKTFVVEAPAYQADGLVYWQLRAGGSTGADLDWFQIYCQRSGIEWLFPESAHDRAARELPLKKFDAMIDGSLVREKFAVTVTRDYLETSKGEGIDIRVDGRRFNHFIKLPGWYVAGFLDGITNAPIGGGSSTQPTAKAASPRKLVGTRS